MVRLFPGPYTERAPGPVSANDLPGLALGAAELSEFYWDRLTDQLQVSARMSALTGLAQGRLLTRRGLALEPYVHLDDRIPAGTAIRCLLADRQAAHFRFRFLAPNGDAARWLDVSASPVFDPGGDLSGVAGVVGEVSAPGKGADQESLIREFDHRLKNVLASVQSLAAQSARYSASTDDFLSRFLGRLDALASVHTLLAANGGRGAKVAAIAQAELGALSPGRARWDGPDLLFTARAANALTMALHELVANALRFGALSAGLGRIDLTWRNESTGGVTLEWRESGGPLVAAPVLQGFGRTLIERVIGRELGGSAVLEFHPEGLRATLTAGPEALAVSDPQAFGQPKPLASPSAEGGSGTSSGSQAEESLAGVRVLIVEDAVLLALELEAGLTEAGARVVGVAYDLDEARRLVERDFDAAVLDTNLNGHSVVAVAHALVARRIPFIFATGYKDANAAIDGFKVPVVRKPYNVRQIAAALCLALSGGSAGPPS